MDKAYSCGMVVAILLLTGLFGFYRWSNNQIEHLENQKQIRNDNENVHFENKCM